MHYIHAGTGRPLVMIHGLTGSTRNWRRNLEIVSRSAKVYALDLVNMGESCRLAGLDAGLEATAARIAAWMDAVGIDRADIAGHSHGGAVAMMLAARHPDRVRSLMLFAPANPYSRSGDRLIRLYRSAPGGLLARMAPFLPRAIHMIALGRMYGDRARIKPGCLEGYVAGLSVRGTMEHVLQIIHRWHDEMRILEPKLQALSEVPVMLVWGDRDRAVSIESGHRLHQELPLSEWHVVSGAGHVAFEEMPEACNGLMLRWLDGLDLPRYHANPLSTVKPAQGEFSRSPGRGVRQVSGQS